MRNLSAHELECVVGGNESDAVKIAKEAAEAAKEAARQLREAMVEVADAMSDSWNHFWTTINAERNCGDNGVNRIVDGDLHCNTPAANPTPAPSGS